MIFFSEYGGIYIDWDTIWLRSPEHLRHFKYAQVSQIMSKNLYKNSGKIIIWKAQGVPQ